MSLTAPRTAVLLLMLAGAWHAPAGHAADDGITFGGHLKYQYTVTDYRADDVAVFAGDDPVHDHSADVRLKLERRAGALDLSAHYELLALAGDTLATRRALDAFGLIGSGTPTGLPDDRARLFDLTGVVSDRDRRAVVHRLDRLSVGYRGENATVRFGRQAVSFGNGLVFHPLDFINPFPPLAIDKDYKTGDDMLYGQWLLSARGPRTGVPGSPPVTPPVGDIQAIWLPRRDPLTHEIESAQSTYAAKLRHRFGAVDLDVLAARHYDERVAGLGVVRSVGGAVWRLDTVYADLAGGGAWSLVTNVDYSWVWFGKNFYGYAEYFRNGFGESGRAAYPAPNADLAARLARGELFTLARDYLAFGGQLEITPLFNLHASVVRNLNDASRVLQVRGVWDWQQNLQLLGGVNWAGGARGSEFGGVPVTGLPYYVSAGHSVYARLAYYF